MKGKFINRDIKSLLESEAIFEIAQAIRDGMDDNLKPNSTETIGTTRTQINEILQEKKSQPTLSLILGLLEKYEVVKVRKEKKTKFYSIEPNEILELFIKSMQEEPLSNYDKEILPYFRSNEFFRKDFFYFVEERFHEPYIMTFASFFNFFKTFYLSAYFYELEPLMMVDDLGKNFAKIKEKSGKDSELMQYVGMWEICKYISSQISPDTEVFSKEDFPNYEKIVSGVNKKNNSIE